MSDPITAGLTSAMLIKAIEAAYGEPIGAVSTHVAQRTLKTFAARLPIILTSPENHDLLRAVRKSYLNAALVLCFGRLKILNPSQWRNRVLQVLPDIREEGDWFDWLERQFLGDDKTIHAEVSWLFLACKNFKQKLKIDKWKPNAATEAAAKTADLLLQPEAAQVEVDHLHSSLQNNLISEFAESAYFERWDKNSTAPEPTDKTERHKQCLPPALLEMILEGWRESDDNRNQTIGNSLLGLSGQTIEFKWFDVMCAFFAEEIKHDEAVRSILQTQLLVDLKYQRNGREADLTVNVFKNELAYVNQAITNRLATIETEVRNLDKGQIEIKNKLDSILLPLIVTLEDISLILKSLPELIKQDGQQTRAKLKETKTEIIDEFRKSKQPPLLPKTLRQAEGFVGRVQYLETLREAYKNDVRKFVLHGLGGVGKTALGLEFANEVAEEYPARVQIEMLGMSEQPFNSRRAMFEIIRQFGQEVAADASDETVKSVYASLVQNQPTLILLDNAKDLDAVKDLAPYNICLIVTSREEFGLTGGKSERIRQMSEADAQELLLSIADEHLYDGRTNELAELAGCLPMALKPLAALVREEWESIEEIINRYNQELLDLKDIDHDDLTIYASFELSYNALPDDALRERWRRLSVFPADFDALAAAAVWRTEHETQSKNSLRELCRRNLLDRDSETKRIAMHDTARRYVLTKLTKAEKFETEMFHSIHYETLLFNVDRGKSRRSRGIRLCSNEWSNIKAGQHWAAENVAKIDLAFLCLNYVEYTFNFLFFFELPLEQIKWFEAGLKAARVLKSNVDECNMLRLLGNSYCNLGSRYKDYSKYSPLENYSTAIKYYNQCLEISRKVGDTLTRGKVLLGLGRVYYGLGELKEAKRYWLDGYAVLKADDTERADFEIVLFRKYLKDITSSVNSSEIKLMCKSVLKKLNGG